jgi:hypothetical protein
MLNGFPSDQPHFNLASVLLQSMFPPVVVKTVTYMGVTYNNIKDQIAIV